MITAAELITSALRGVRTRTFHLRDGSTQKTFSGHASIGGIPTQVRLAEATNDVDAARARVNLPEAL